MIIKKTVVINRIVNIEIDTDKITGGYYQDGVPDEVIRELAKDIACQKTWCIHVERIVARPIDHNKAENVPARFKLTDYIGHPFTEA